MFLVQRSKQFLKSFNKLPYKTKLQVHARLNLLVADPGNQLLKLHQLKGGFYPLWSINVSGDCRVLFYTIVEEEKYLLVNVGTHSQLYGR